MTGPLPPPTPPTAPALQALAATAVAASAINIGGGFTITQRMLDMFKRPGDPVEHNNLYAYPAGLLVGGYALGALLSSGEAPGITSAAYLASSALCIAAIGCLSNQSSARTGACRCRQGWVGSFLQQQHASAQTRLSRVRALSPVRKCTHAQHR